MQNFRPAGGERTLSRRQCCFELKSARGAAGWSVAGGGRLGGGSTAPAEQQQREQRDDACQEGGGGERGVV